MVVIGLAMSDAAMAQPKPKTFDVWLKADAEIAVDGTVRALQWRDERPLAKLVIARIDPLIKSWEFVPGTVDGKPAPTQTHLSVQILGEERDDGTVTLKFGKASTGAASDKLTPPSYPHGAIRDGVSAWIVAEVDVEASGNPIIRSIAFAGSRSTSYRKEFIAAAEAAIKAWTIRPEMVAGRPVLARMSIPITFCAGDSWCERQKRTQQQAKQSAEIGPVGMPVALDSVVRLVTQVDGEEI